MLYCVFCCWLLITIRPTAKLVLVDVSILTFTFTSSSVCRVSFCHVWWAVGFSGSPLPCLLTMFALLYFVQCTMTNKYDWMIDTRTHLTAADDICTLAQKVYHPALALVAPLCTDYHCYFSLMSSSIIPRATPVCDWIFRHCCLHHRTEHLRHSAESL